MNPDFLKERSNASFSSKELEYWLDGGREKTDLKLKFQKIVEEDKAFDWKDLIHGDRNHVFKRGLESGNVRIGEKMGGKAFALKKKMNLTDDEYFVLRSQIPEMGSTQMHDVAFLPYIRGQCDEEQSKYWVPLAENLQIIGAYSQTELGHGSNVRGLETKATYIPEREEFELETPTLTSTKWWSGTLGKTATHAVVMANLISKGHNHGVHGFILQIRSLKDHSPLPGITVGDIGPKFGMNAMDNGYLRLDKVRIPRKQMLMRFSRIEKDGTYVKATAVSDKLAYLGMVGIRAGIVNTAGSILARAVTVAVRYSLVRRQFGQSTTSENDKREKQILDYQAQQHRIFVPMSAAFAMICTGRYMKQLHSAVEKGLKEGNADILPEVHATSAGLKSLVTRITLEGIETCRQTLGGHGFLKISGLSDLVSTYAGLVTAEGENYLMTQQTGQYLLKCLNRVQQGKTLVGNSKYLESAMQLIDSKSQAEKPEDFLVETEIGQNTLLNAYKHRAARIVVRTAMKLQESLSLGPENAWNECLIDVYRMSRAHCLLTCVTSFIQTCNEVKNTGFGKVFNDLCSLFCLAYIEEDLGEFLEGGHFSSEQAATIHKLIPTLLKRIRPNALALTDSFGFSDRSLRTILGAYDGNVYEKVWEATKQEPLNKQVQPPGYAEYLKPFLQSKL